MMSTIAGPGKKNLDAEKEEEGEGRRRVEGKWRKGFVGKKIQHDNMISKTRKNNSGTQVRPFTVMCLLRVGNGNKRRVQSPRRPDDGVCVCLALSLQFNEFVFCFVLLNQTKRISICIKLHQKPVCFLFLGTKRERLEVNRFSIVSF